MSRATLTSLLAVALTAALAVGCSSEQPEASPAPPAASTSPAKPDATSSTGPSATPKPTASEPPASPRPSSAPRERGRHKVGALVPHLRAKAKTAAHLLAAEDLPVLAGEWASDTGAEESPVGACQKTDLVSIGAMETSLRTFTADDATAIQVVARFADTRSAWRAHKVLAAWREDCAERLGRSAVNIGPLAEIRVPIGTGASYRAAYRKSTAGLGILRTGTYLTVLEITAGSGDYPEKWEPARVAVRRVARTFETA